MQAINSLEYDIDVTTNLDGFEGTDFYGSVNITLPSTVWISPNDAKLLAMQLINAADEVDAYLKEHNEK